MAWHKYRKLSASPSLTVGLNLPTYLCRDDTKDRKRVFSFSTTTPQQLMVSTSALRLNNSFGWASFNLYLHTRLD